MEKGWIKIFTSTNFYPAEIVKQMLIENSIDAVLINKQLSGYNIGSVEVYIHQEDFSKAVELMALNDIKP